MSVDGGRVTFTHGDSTSLFGYEHVTQVLEIQPLVERRVTNLSGGEGLTLATDTSGNVFVAGAGSTVKYSSSGVPLWTDLFRHPYTNSLSAPQQFFHLKGK